MNIKIINEPIVLVRELYENTTKKNRMSFKKWCETYLKADERGDVMMLDKAIELIKNNFLGCIDLFTWIENWKLDHDNQETDINEICRQFRELHDKYYDVRTENDTLKDIILQMTKEKYNLKKN